MMPRNGATAFCGEFEQELAPPLFFPMMVMSHFAYAYQYTTILAPDRSQNTISSSLLRLALRHLQVYGAVGTQASVELLVIFIDIGGITIDGIDIHRVAPGP